MPGGGLTLLRCTEAVQREEGKCDGDERTGVQILKRALEMPTRQIAENSAVDGGVAVARMAAGLGNFGFDAGRDAIVMGSHGRRGISAIVLGSETVKVLTHSTIPVIVVRGQSPAAFFAAS